MPDADHGVVGAGHPDVGQRRRAPGRTRASEVWTCVCVPSDRGDPPVEPVASATFSLVASAWMSTTIDRRRLSRLLDQLVDELPHAPGGLEVERAQDVDDRDRRASRAVTTASPRPGGRRMLAGRTTRSDSLEVRGDLRRRQVWLPERDRIGARRQDRSASRGVIPTPSATFSPLTTQTSTPSSSRSRGSRPSIASRPGRPTTSPTKRIRMRAV